MRRLGTALLLLLLAAFARASDTPQIQGRRVMDQVLEALGGPRFMAMEDRVETGRAYSFYREELSGLSVATIYTRYLKDPGRLPAGALAIRERQAFGKSEDSAVLFTQDGGFQITFRGARPLPEETLARYRDTTRQNFFYILRVRQGEPGLIYEFRGRDIVDNQPVEILDITGPDNRTVTVYINQSTHLPVRQVIKRRDPKTKDVDEEVTFFSKYRDAGGGAMWPFAIERQRNGERVYQIFADTVEINRGLRDDLFTLPANIKMLKPQK